MNLDFTPEENAFRDEVRAFIKDNYPARLRAAQDEGRALTKEEYLLWHKVLAKKGWLAPSWPVEHGGTGWTPTQKYIWSEETARADCLAVLPFGVSMLAPVLYTFGTEEQKKRFLPDIYNGEVWWCQGYSEPGAGSDLASLKCKAERMTADDGKEYYIVNGQKTWTTLGQHADWGFFLVRTDPDSKPQSGISFLGLITVSFVLVVVTISGLRLVPVYIEHYTITKVVRQIANDPELANASTADVRAAFSRQATIDSVKVISASDLEITREAGQLVIETKYQVKTPVASNISLLIDFKATSR